MAYRLAAAILLVSCLVWAVDGKCVNVEDLEHCPMIDYNVYDTLNVKEAHQQAKMIADHQVQAWKAHSSNAAGKKKAKLKGLCEHLIR